MDRRRARRFRQRAIVLDRRRDAARRPAGDPWRSPSCAGDHPLVAAAARRRPHLVRLVSRRAHACWSSCATTLRPRQLPADAELRELRPLAPLLPPDSASLLAYARALALWKARHRFCGVCGAPNLPARAGHVMRCSRAGCGTEVFPAARPGDHRAGHRRRRRARLVRPAGILAGGPLFHHRRLRRARRKSRRRGGARGRGRNRRAGGRRRYVVLTTLAVPLLADAGVPRRGAHARDHAARRRARGRALVHARRPGRRPSRRCRRAGAISARLIDGWFSAPARPVRSTGSRHVFVSPRVAHASALSARGRARIATSSTRGRRRRSRPWADTGRHRRRPRPAGERRLVRGRTRAAASASSPISASSGGAGAARRRAAGSFPDTSRATARRRSICGRSKPTPRVTRASTCCSPTAIRSGTRPIARTSSRASCRPGIYGLSNEFLDTPWPKLVRVRARFDRAAAVDAEAADPALDRRLVRDAGRPRDGAARRPAARQICPPNGRASCPRRSCWIRDLWHALLDGPHNFGPDDTLRIAERRFDARRRTRAVTSEHVLNASSTRVDGRRESRAEPARDRGTLIRISAFPPQSGVMPTLQINYCPRLAALTLLALVMAQSRGAGELAGVADRSARRRRRTIRANVLAYLSFERYKNSDDLSPEFVERLQERSEREVRGGVAALRFLRARGHLGGETRRQWQRAELPRHHRPSRAAKPVVVEKVDVKVTGPGANDKVFTDITGDLPIQPGDTLNHSNYETLKGDAAAHRAPPTAISMRAWCATRCASIRRRASRSIDIEFETGERYKFGATTIKQDVHRRCAGAPLPALPRGRAVQRHANCCARSSRSTTASISPPSKCCPRSAIAKHTSCRSASSPNRIAAAATHSAWVTARTPQVRGTVAWEDRRVNQRGHRFRTEIKAAALAQSIDARYHRAHRRSGDRKFHAAAHRRTRTHAPTSTIASVNFIAEPHAPARARGSATRAGSASPTSNSCTPNPSSSPRAAPTHRRC